MHRLQFRPKTENNSLKKKHSYENKFKKNYLEINLKNSYSREKDIFEGNPRSFHLDYKTKISVMG